MKRSILEILKQIQSNNLSGRELEEKEFLLLQELCSSGDLLGICTILRVLGLSGTTLSIPVLLGLSQGEDEEIKILVTSTIKSIQSRAQARGSILPEIFYTIEHWRPKWHAGKNVFLSYVQFIANAYIDLGHPESELNRIGKILADEMNMDITPYESFGDYMICQTGWDFAADMEIIKGRMAEERVLEDMRKIGVTESDVSLVTGFLMELQYDYLIARLKLKGDLAYYRFIFEMAEALNKAKS